MPFLPFMNSISAVIFFVEPVILLIAARILWNRKPRWIPHILVAAAIIKVLSIVMIHPSFFPDWSINGLPGLIILLFFPLLGLLLPIAAPIIILILAMQIKRMELQHNVQLSSETKKTDTVTNDVKENGIVDVRCPNCGKMLKIPRIHLHNTGKCKFCNTEFVPYEHTRH